MESSISRVGFGFITDTDLVGFGSITDPDLKYIVAIRGIRAWGPEPHDTRRSFAGRPCQASPQLKALGIAPTRGRHSLAALRPAGSRLTGVALLRKPQVKDSMRQSALDWVPLSTDG